MSPWIKSYRLVLPLIVTAVHTFLSCTGQVTREITTGELQGHVQYLSSDMLKGRQTGSEGDSLAAVYIRKQFEMAGLVPLEGNGFQEFSVTDRVVAGKSNFFILDGQEFNPSEDITPFSFSGNSSLEAPVVFTGYGLIISNDSIKWNDYGNHDVKGKWVLVLRGDPEPEKSVSGFIPFNSDRDKAMTAKDMGAAGVLFVSGPANDNEDSFDSLSAEGFSVGIPVLRIKRNVADLILKRTNNTVAALEKQINATKKTAAFDTGARVRAGSDVQKTASSTRNVIMYLRGEDESLRNEYVIIGAHFDHLGMGGPASRARDTIAVHHGADDNASGVSAMIELAERFALTPGSHRRSLVFTAFSGEESGLLGSRYFTDNPLVDLSMVDAMINLDMVGRLQDSSLQIGGIGTAEKFRDIITSLTDTSRFRLSLSEEGYGPSDHSSFYGKDIPVLFFSSGAHLDYHTPSDTWDKLNYPGMKDISDLVFSIAGSIANTPERLEFREAGPKTGISTVMRRKGVTLGIMPDYSGNIKNGLRADLVTPGKPAALGGMKKGDIITSINGMTVSNIQDYMYRMSRLKHGETISVEVLRNGNTVVLIIQL